MKNGVYALNGKYASRIAHKGKTLHLGTYGTEDEAAKVFDTASLVLSRPLTGYNFPDENISLGRIKGMLSYLTGKGVIDEEAIRELVTRFTLLDKIAEALNDTQETTSRT
jgi:hypothetical protein